MISKLVDLFWGALELVWDLISTSGENRKRRQAKRLQIEEIHLNKLIATVQGWITEAQNKPVSHVGGKYVNPRIALPGHKRNLADLQRQLFKNRRRQTQLVPLYGGKLDYDPEPAWRSIKEVLGDMFASLRPSTTEKRAYQLECLAESLAAHIESTIADREQHKLRMWTKPYFACDRELIRLKAQLRKTESRILSLRDKLVYA